jgi:hypothetical protein
MISQAKISPSPDAFIFDNFSIDSHYLVFSFSGHITGPGVYALDLGAPNGPDSFPGSGEFVDALLDYRVSDARIPCCYSAWRFGNRGDFVFSGERHHCTIRISLIAEASPPSFLRSAAIVSHYFVQVQIE